MNSKQIDCILEVSHTLNFSRAAENLYISQPSLSYQIQSLENEIGFVIFNRFEKGVTLTPAGEQFCREMRKVKEEIRSAIESGQNMSTRYKEAINVCIPMRSCIIFLPQIMRRFRELMPEVALNIRFVYGEERVDSFLRGEQDILFARDSEMSRYSHIALHPIYESRIYLITEKSDPLAKKEIISAEDLDGRVLMIGGGSPPELERAQKSVIERGKVELMNCPDHDTVLTSIAAGLGVCLSVGFANDRSDEFAWIPFDTTEKIKCVLACRKDDKRESIKHFIELTQSSFTHADVLSL